MGSEMCIRDRNEARSVIDVNIGVSPELDSIIETKGEDTTPPVPPYKLSLGKAHPRSERNDSHGSIARIEHIKKPLIILLKYAFFG